jgi:hypothetical protein
MIPVGRLASYSLASQELPALPVEIDTARCSDASWRQWWDENKHMVGLGHVCFLEVLGVDVQDPAAAAAYLQLFRQHDDEAVLASVPLSDHAVDLLIDALKAVRRLRRKRRARRD